MEVLPGWRESLAVDAPRGEEVDEPRLVIKHSISSLRQHMVEEEFFIEQEGCIRVVWFISLSRIVLHPT